MDDFLDYIEKYKFAIIATVVIHLGFFLWSNFTTVKDITRIVPPDIDVEIPLDEIEFDEEMMKLLELDQPQINNQNIANVVADANDNRTKSYEDYSTYEEDINNPNPTDLKELEAKYFEEAAANNEKRKELELREKHELKTYENVTKNTTSGSKNAYAGEVMISYNLKDRKAYALPNPGYTCYGSGTVVVEIKVDKSGEVKYANYAGNLSSNATECMIERALKFAKKSRFDYVSNTGLQNGTITYKFVGQK